jgi:hypothetical protein
MAPKSPGGVHMESKRTIASLALLNANSRVRGRDFIDNFVPFLAALLRTKGYEYIDDLGPLSDDFQELFGLVVPYYPMQSIVNRARKHSWGIVSRQRGRFRVNADAAAKWDISPQATTQSRRMNAVIGQFWIFPGTQ